MGGTSAWVADAVAVGAVPDAAADVVPGAAADAVPGGVAGAEVGADAGTEVGAVAEADDANGNVTVVVADAGDVAPAPLADAVLEVATMLAISTPTPSAAPLSSVTSGMLTFMPSTHPTIVWQCGGTRPDRTSRQAGRTGEPRRGAEPS